MGWNARAHISFQRACVLHVPFAVPWLVLVWFFFHCFGPFFSTLSRFQYGEKNYGFVLFYLRLAVAIVFLQNQIRNCREGRCVPSIFLSLGLHCFHLWATNKIHEFLFDLFVFFRMVFFSCVYEFGAIWSRAHCMYTLFWVRWCFSSLILNGCWWDSVNDDDDVRCQHHFIFWFVRHYCCCCWCCCCCHCFSFFFSSCLKTASYLLCRHLKSFQFIVCDSINSNNSNGFM